MYVWEGRGKGEEGGCRGAAGARERLSKRWMVLSRADVFVCSCRRCPTAETCVFWADLLVGQRDR